VNPRDQQLSLLRSEARRKFQVMIDYIKEQVGQGREYSNELVRVVISERGCYYEFVHMPEEFSGAVGTGFKYEFAGTQVGLEMMEKIQQIIAQADDSNTRELSLLAIYSREGIFAREDTYIYHHALADGEEEGPVTVGHFRPGVLPLFFKVKLDSDLALPLLGARKGVLFFVTNLTDQHLLVRIPQHGLGLTDLSQIPTSQMVH